MKPSTRYTYKGGMEIRIWADEMEIEKEKHHSSAVMFATGLYPRKARYSSVHLDTHIL